MVPLIRLARYLKPYRKECVLGPLFKFFEAILELLLPTIMALIVNNGIGRRDSGYILRMGGLMAALAACGYGSALICQLFAARASQGFGTDLRNTLFDHISRFSYAQLDRFGTPTLTNRITNDINQLQLWVAMMIRLVIRAPLICIGAIIMSMILDFRLSLILIAVTPVLAAVIYLITAKAAPLYRLYQKKLDKLALILREHLAGVRVIRAFAKTGDELRRFGDANDSLTDTGLAIGRVSSLLNPLTSLAVNAAIILILLAGGFPINAGRLSQGQIIALINYVTQILYALVVISNLVILLTKASASAARVNEILAVSPGIPDAGAISFPAASADTPVVRFDDVSFAYNTAGDTALSHITAEIRRGETIGIIGGTGSGKSTLVHLIARFYDPTAGAVYVDGVDAREYPSGTLRAKIGLVPQKAALFTGTVAENIRWGKPDAGDEEIREAARIAQADEFISALPEGYGTPVRRAGVNFSGGQKQRLTIARALIRKPEILILDDASSALDFTTDARLRSAIRRSGAGAVILISQRIGVVKSADRIFVMDDGRLAGAGTHRRLLESCEVYRDICRTQLTEKEAAQ